MKLLARSAARFWTGETGASMVEYGVAILIVAAIGAGAMSTLAGPASTNVTSACAQLDVAC